MVWTWRRGRGWWVERSGGAMKNQIKNILRFSVWNDQQKYPENELIRNKNLLFRWERKSRGLEPIYQYRFSLQNDGMIEDPWIKWTFAEGNRRLINQSVMIYFLYFLFFHFFHFHWMETENYTSTDQPANVFHRNWKILP